MSDVVLIGRIRAIGQPLIDAGVAPSEVRDAVYQALGVVIGNGGKGGRFGGGGGGGSVGFDAEQHVTPGGPGGGGGWSLDDVLCPWCEATGNGGHGGLCPNAGLRAVVECKTCGRPVPGGGHGDDCSGTVTRWA